MNKYDLLFVFCLSISGFEFLYCDEQSKQRHEFLESNLLHVTKNDLEDILDRFEKLEDFPISLNELKAFSLKLNDDEVKIINKAMIEFFCISLEYCKNASNEECYCNVIGNLYNRLKMNIENDIDPLLDKKIEHSRLFLVYFLSKTMIKEILSGWKN
jgi:hypothetical protein